MRCGETSRREATRSLPPAALCGFCEVFGQDVGGGSCHAGRPPAEVRQVSGAPEWRDPRRKGPRAGGSAATTTDSGEPTASGPRSTAGRAVTRVDAAGRPAPPMNNAPGGPPPTKIPGKDSSGVIRGGGVTRVRDRGSTADSQGEISYLRGSAARSASPPAVWAVMRGSGAGCETLRPASGWQRCRRGQDLREASVCARCGGAKEAKGLPGCRRGGP